MLSINVRFEVDEIDWNDAVLIVFNPFGAKTKRQKQTILH